MPIRPREAGAPGAPLPETAAPGASAPRIPDARPPAFGGPVIPAAAVQDIPPPAPAFCPLIPLGGRFWRILPAAADPLSPVRSPEGRFHHSGQPALYCSPSPEAAGHAVAPYLRPGDPPRLAFPLHLHGARIADLRDPATLAALGLHGHETAVPWLPERAAGRPATTWTASGAARAAGACGMIYTARSAPDRWHLVLFRWNAATGAQLARAGAPLPAP